MDKQFCRGCRDNFYNGNNDYGVKECWLLEDAKREPRLLIPINMPPPYTSLKPQSLPTCYHADGYSTVKPDSLTTDGYWR
jgi:hypothetical protein